MQNKKAIFKIIGKTCASCNMSNKIFGNVRLRLIFSTLFSFLLFMGMFFKFDFGIFLWLNIFLSSIIVFIFGWPFHCMAYQQMKKGQMNMDTLISMGTIIAYFFSLWLIANRQVEYLEAGSMIITLVLLGKYLEDRSIQKTEEAMQSILELGVKKARILACGEEKEVEIEKLKVGDVLVVNSGEKIPLDGYVLEGESMIDESMLTGESRLVDKKAGDYVFGSMLNQGGILKVRVEKTGEGTVLAQIIRTIEDVQNSKIPIQKLADKIVRIFVPIVLMLAIITFLGWFLGGYGISRAIIYTISVLVIACPCSLGLAIPTAIMVGIGNGAKKGILFKTGEGFENIKDISMVIFDKTGTLTKGKPIVVDFFLNPEEKMTKKESFNLAQSLAINSEHPYSKAIMNYIMLQGLIGEKQLLKKIVEYNSRGILAMDNFGKNVFLGNKKSIEQEKIKSIWAEKLLSDPMNNRGTLLFIGQGDAVMGAFLVADEIRKEAFEVVTKLKKMKLKVAMISGDRSVVAKSVAKALGIETVISDVLPAEKLEAIKNFQSQGERIIFVGDGINDAPSLIMADLGIAMGNAMNIAKEAGQIVLLENNLKKVIEAIQISRKTFHTIRQNLFWSFFYNSLAIPLAMFGFLSPAIAAMAMSFSSISVVLNSLRLRK